MFSRFVAHIHFRPCQMFMIYVLFSLYFTGAYLIETLLPFSDQLFISVVRIFFHKDVSHQRKAVLSFNLFISLMSITPDFKCCSDSCGLNKPTECINLSLIARQVAQLLSCGFCALSRGPKPLATNFTCKELFTATKQQGEIAIQGRCQQSLGVHFIPPYCVPN